MHDQKLLMNRKNPGVIETEPVGRSDELRFYRLSAVGWTIAAIVYTAFTLWRWGGARLGDVPFAWLMVAWAWWVFVREWRKERRQDKR